MQLSPRVQSTAVSVPRARFRRLRPGTRSAVGKQDARAEGPRSCPTCPLRRVRTHRVRIVTASRANGRFPGWLGGLVPAPASGRRFRCRWRRQFLSLKALFAATGTAKPQTWQSRGRRTVDATICSIASGFLRCGTVCRPKRGGKIGTKAFREKPDSQSVAKRRAWFLCCAPFVFS